MFYEIIISDCSEYVNSLSKKIVECSIFLKPYFGIYRIIPNFIVYYSSKNLFMQKNSSAFSEDCPAVLLCFVLFFVTLKCKCPVICNICNYSKRFHFVTLCPKLISAALKFFFYYRTNSHYFATCLLY